MVRADSWPDSPYTCCFGRPVASCCCHPFSHNEIVSKNLEKIIRSDSIQSKTVKESDKALGTAAGAGISFYILTALLNLPANETTGFELPGMLEDFIPNILQFIFAVSLVVWAFRLVSIVKDVVELFDKDGELDGSEKTLISAVESLLRFLIIALGAVFIADALGFNLTSLVAGLGISGLARTRCKRHDFQFIWCNDGAS